MERSETMTDYRTFSADELLAALELAGWCPDLELVHACMERREELVPGLLAMLAGGTDKDWERDDPRWYREIHAGLLLIALREPAALPIFAAILRDEERDDLVEWFGTELPAYGPAATQMTIDLLNDRDAYEYGRAAATELLAAIALNHPGERERILAALRAQLPPLAEDGSLVLASGAEYDHIWTWATSALADLRDTVSQPQIIALYERRLINAGIIGDLEYYLACFEPDAPPPLAASREYDVLKTYKWLHRQAAKKAKQRTKAARRAHKSQRTPASSVPQTTGAGQPAQRKRRKRKRRKRSK